VGSPHWSTSTSQDATVTHQGIRTERDEPNLPQAIEAADEWGTDRALFPGSCRSSRHFGGLQPPRRLTIGSAARFPPARCAHRWNIVRHEPGWHPRRSGAASARATSTVLGSKLFQPCSRPSLHGFSRVRWRRSMGQPECGDPSAAGDTIGHDHRPTTSDFPGAKAFHLSSSSRLTGLSDRDRPPRRSGWLFH